MFLICTSSENHSMPTCLQYVSLNPILYSTWDSDYYSILPQKPYSVSQLPTELNQAIKHCL